jgi:hypothetical protein
MPKVASLSDDGDDYTLAGHPNKGETVGYSDMITRRGKI